jgi:hypothetical protein
MLLAARAKVAMKTVWLVLGALGFMSGAAFLVFWLLAWTGQVPPGAPLAVSAGLMSLVTGLFQLREAFSKTGSRGKWGRSNVRLGRLSALGVGLWFTAGGVAIVGYGWLTERIIPAILGAFAAGFVLTMVGMRSDGRRAEAARTAVRRRGWLTACRRREDAELPADEIQRREDAREVLRRSIQSHLTGRTTLDRVETQYAYLQARAGDADCPTDWPEVAPEWLAFRSTFAEGDEIWDFNTLSTRRGLASREEGLALVRDGTVVDWFITAIVG